MNTQTASRALALHSSVVAAPDQISCDLAGETVILSLADSTYYGLDAIGSLIWEFVKQPRSVAEIRDRIMSEYAVDAERCERDLLALLQKMSERGLIQVEDGPSA